MTPTFEELLEKINKCQELLNDPFVLIVLESIPCVMTSITTGENLKIDFNN